MGKHEVGTPKYIANKIKSKGLQKLRWYCQMCQKQCRDENGFKCHTMSESHHRQLLLFADNASKYMDQFSREFSDGFLHLLKRQFGTRRVLSNRVYQDYITDRQHMHMNATQWLSLTAYVKWLGRTGKCIVDETEKGWYITYIDRDPETVAAEEKKAKKQKMDKDDEERLMEFIGKQVEKGSVEKKSKAEESATPLIRSEEDGPLVLEMKLKPKASLLMGPPVGLVKKSAVKIKEEPSDSDNASLVDWNENNRSREPSECRSTISCKRKTDDDGYSKKLKADSRSSEDKPSTSQGWLQENLVVKVITQSLGSKYYKAKGVVLSPVLESGFVGKIKLTSPEEVQGHIVKLDQEHLETVIPAIGREVMIIQGKYRGSVGTVEKVRVEDFAVDVNITKDDKYVKRIPYESICKFIR